MLEHFLNRVQEKIADRSAAPVLIVALGDSVTQGLAEVDQLLHEQVYHARLKRLLEQRWPLCTFSVLNAGVDGQNIDGGLARLDRDVIRHQPDLVLIAFALNDAVGGGLAGLAAYGDSLTRMIQRLRTHTQADIILVTPNMMLTRDNDAIPACYCYLAATLLAVQQDGVLKAYVERMCQVGEELGVPVAATYAAWQALAERGVDTTAMLANGLNHPTAAAHQLAADQIMAVIVIKDDET